MTWTQVYRGRIAGGEQQYIRALDQRVVAAGCEQDAVVMVLHGTPQHGDGCTDTGCATIYPTGRAAVCYGGGSIWGDYADGVLTPDDPDGQPIRLA